MSNTSNLRALLEKPQLLAMPGCHDAMSAKLIEQAGFSVGFMSGFAVSAQEVEKIMKSIVEMMPDK